MQAMGSNILQSQSLSAHTSRVRLKGLQRPDRVLIAFKWSCHLILLRRTTDAAGASLLDPDCLPRCRDKFTLHGLWPSYYSKCRGRPYPEGPSCAPQCDCPFDVSTLEDLKPHLGEEWPSYMGPDEGFWWGPCDRSDRTQMPFEVASTDALGILPAGSTNGTSTVTSWRS